MWESEEYLLHYNQNFSERLESSKKSCNESFSESVTYKVKI